jgi:ankyrin repeat protein
MSEGSAAAATTTSSAPTTHSTNGLCAAIYANNKAKFDEMLSIAPHLALSADANGRTAVQVAAECDAHEMLHALLQLRTVTPATVNEAEPIEQRSALMFAVAANAQRCVALLLEHGADVRQRDVLGREAVHLAAKGNRTVVLFALLKAAAGAAASAVQSVDLEGRTPLHWAATVDAGWCVTLLLRERACDVNAVDRRKQTALHLAAAGGHEESVRLLVEHGASFELRDVDGLTPDDAARVSGNSAIANLLGTGRRRGRSFVAPDIAHAPLARMALFLVPSLLVPMACLFCATYGVFAWQSLLCGFAVIAALARVQQFLWPVRNNRSRFPAGISLAAIVWIMGSHWVVLWPASDMSAVGMHLLAFVVELVCIATFAYSMLADPGTVQSREEFRDAASVRAMLHKTVDDERFCVVCELVRPVRARHCRLCGMCVSRYDHHCAWTDNCVGYNNHRGFLVFCATSCVSLLLILSFAIQYFRAVPNAPHDSFWFTWTFFRFASEANGFLAYLCLFALWTLAMHALVLRVQLGHISSNETLYERARARVGRPCLPPPLDHLPFDRGLEGNWREFWRMAGSAVDWSAVFTPQAALSATVV